MMIRRRITRSTSRIQCSSSLGNPSYEPCNDLHLIGRAECEFCCSATKMAPAVNSAGFAWCGRPVNQFETCMPVQLKSTFTKRTAYRKQRAIIMSLARRRIPAADLEYDHPRRNRPQVSNQRKINFRFAAQVIPRQTRRTQLRRISLQPRDDYQPL